METKSSILSIKQLLLCAFPAGVSAPSALGNAATNSPANCFLSETHFATGRFKVTLPTTSTLQQTTQESKTSADKYWTNPLSFAVIPEQSPELLADLQKADLVVFKGDLNYRKLTRYALGRYRPLVGSLT